MDINSGRLNWPSDTQSSVQETGVGETRPETLYAHACTPTSHTASSVLIQNIDPWVGWAEDLNRSFRASVDSSVTGVHHIFWRNGHSHHCTPSHFKWFDCHIHRKANTKRKTAEKLYIKHEDRSMTFTVESWKNESKQSIPGSASCIMEEKTELKPWSN
jgi:hypothetical protein